MIQTVQRPVASLKLVNALGIENFDEKRKVLKQVVRFHGEDLLFKDIDGQTLVCLSETSTLDNPSTKKLIKKWSENRGLPIETWRRIKGRLHAVLQRVS